MKDIKVDFYVFLTNQKPTTMGLALVFLKCGKVLQGSNVNKSKDCWFAPFRQDILIIMKRISSAVHMMIFRVVTSDGNVAIYGWPEQTIPLSVSARNQTKDFWTWNLAVSGSGKGTRERSWRRDSRDASQQKSWRGTTDRGSQQRTPKTVAGKRESSHGEEDWLEMPAFQLLCGIFASNPR